MMEKPIWFEYLVWDYSDESFPTPKGFRKDTPSDVIEAYKKARAEMKKLEEENPDVKYV